MGQTKKEEEAEIVYVKTRLKSSTYPMIVLPQKILEHIYIETGTKIMKLHIENDIETVYIWEYNPNRKPYIVFKELKHGEYKITIKPYTLKDFLREYNTKMREKGITLTIEDGNLIVTVKNQGKIKTKEWKFEKEHGGAVHIIAEYNSPSRARGKVTIKFQIKRGRADIYLLERQGSRERLSPHKVTDIKMFAEYVEIYYKHGVRVKTASFLSKNPQAIHEEHGKKIKTLDRTIINIAGYKVRRYRYRVVNREFAGRLSNDMIISYRLLKMGNKKQFEAIREKIGIDIAAEYLKSLGFNKIFIHPDKMFPNYLMKAYFGGLKPDIIAFKGDNMVVIEVKFRFSERKGKEAIKEAIEQVKKYVKEIKRRFRTPPYRIFNEYFSSITPMIFIIGFNHKIKGGYIFQWEEKERRW